MYLIDLQYHVTNSIHFIVNVSAQWSRNCWCSSSFSSQRAMEKPSIWLLLITCTWTVLLVCKRSGQLFAAKRLLNINQSKIWSGDLTCLCSHTCDQTLERQHVTLNWGGTAMPQDWNTLSPVMSAFLCSNKSALYHFIDELSIFSSCRVWLFYVWWGICSHICVSSHVILYCMPLQTRMWIETILTLYLLPLCRCHHRVMVEHQLYGNDGNNTPHIANGSLVQPLVTG